MIVVATCGPNPAPITELLWALAERGETVVAAHVVLESGRARGYWESEFVGAASELRRATDRVPALGAIHVSVATHPDGTVPPDANGPELPAALRDPLWAAARAAQRAAGTAPVVFALTGGRWRGATALMTTTYQLLGRRQDRLVDVRVSEPAAEGGTGFYFPTQADQDLYGVGKRASRRFRAASVDVLLDAIEVPRLRALLAEEDLRRFDLAVAAGQRELDARRAPDLVVDLEQGAIRVDASVIDLSPDRFALYGLLAVAARDGEPWVGTTDEARIHAFLEQQAKSGRRHWVFHLKSKPLQALRDRGTVPADDVPLLAQVWSKLASRLTDACDQAGLPGRDLVVPRSADGHFGQRRLFIPPDRLTVLG